MSALVTDTRICAICRRRVTRWRRPYVELVNGWRTHFLCWLMARQIINEIEATVMKPRRRTAQGTNIRKWPVPRTQPKEQHGR